MTMMQRAMIMLGLAGIAGFGGVPILAIMFAVAGLVMLDLIMLSRLWRLIFRRKG